jgi:hypothetical protein
MADAWTLAELSKIETDTLRKSVIDTLLMESNILQLVPWETIGQLATTIVRVQDLPSVGFRKINEGYAAGVGHFEQKVENISLMGCYLDCDKAIARAKNTIADARAIAQVMALKAMAYKFNDKFINGDPTTDPEEFKGLQKRVEDVVAEGYDGQYIDNAGTSGDGILLSDAESHNFLNKLDELIYSIKGHQPDLLFMSKKMLLALRSLLRKQKLLDSTKDMFDRRVDTYSNCQLIDIGVKADQITNIITNTETLEAAGAAESTSIYAVKFGIGELLWGIQEYPMEVEDKGILEATPVYRTEIDWPLGLALADPRAVGRLYGIIPDSST